MAHANIINIEHTHTHTLKCCVFSSDLEQLGADIEYEYSYRVLPVSYAGRHSLGRTGWNRPAIQKKNQKSQRDPTWAFDARQSNQMHLMLAHPVHSLHWKRPIFELINRLALCLFLFCFSFIQRHVLYVEVWNIDSSRGEQTHELKNIRYFNNLIFFLLFVSILFHLKIITILGVFIAHIMRYVQGSLLESLQKQK